MAPEALKPEVRAEIFGGEVSRPVAMASGVHPVGHVIGQKHRDPASIQQASICAKSGSPPDKRRHNEAEDQPNKKCPANEHDLLILLELGIHAAIEKQAAKPADIRMPKAM